MHRRSPLTGNIFWIGALLWLGFIPFIFIVPRQELFEILNAVVFAVGLGIVIGYVPGVWQSLKYDIRELRSGDALQIGIVVAWLATAIIFGVLWWWRLSGKSSEIIDNEINAFARWLLITAGFLHLVASGSVDGQMPLRSYLRAGILVAIGITVGVITVTLAQGGMPRL